VASACDCIGDRIVQCGGNEEVLDCVNTSIQPVLCVLLGAWSMEEVVGLASCTEAEYEGT